MKESQFPYIPLYRPYFIWQLSTATSWWIVYRSYVAQSAGHPLPSFPGCNCQI